MALRDKLDARRSSAKDRFPPEDLAVMRRATEALRNSGILNRALSTSSQAPDWEWPDSQGTTVRSRDLLAKGPLVLTFFRGVW
jgi:hypothetical protein